MGSEATKAITSTKPITNSNTQKAHFWPAIQASSDEHPHQHRENHRAGVVQDRQSIERFNDLGRQAGDFRFFKRPSARIGESPLKKDDDGQYQGGEEEVGAAPNGENGRTSSQHFAFSFVMCCVRFRTADSVSTTMRPSGEREGRQPSHAPTVPIYAALKRSFATGFVTPEATADGLIPFRDQPDRQNQSPAGVSGD